MRVSEFKLTGTDPARRAALNLMEDAVQARLEAERLNAALREGERRFREMIDALPTAIYTTDAEGRITHYNPAAAEFAGRAPQLGDDEWCVTWKLFRPDGTPLPHDECPMAIALKEGRVIRGSEAIAERPDGTRVWFEPYPTPLRNEAGEIVGGINMLVDITDRRQHEAINLQKQKLESMGVLAGGIAHDFNNLLTGILGAGSLVADMPKLPEEARPLMDGIVSACTRAADLTRQILAYAGKGRFVIEPVDVPSQAREIVGLIRASIPRNVDINLDLQPVPSVIGDRGQVQQVIMNLVLNAADSIDEREGGAIWISTGFEHFDEKRVKAVYSPVEAKPGSYVVFRVRDEGIGMDDETSSRMFDPFFSTKAQGRGLGLSAVLGIVRGQKGGLRVLSSPGKGSTFDVLFPVQDALTPLVADPSEPLRFGREASVTTATGTILVVDDEAMIRGVCRAALERFGFDVLTAENGTQGLKIFKKKSQDIACVLLDLTMPVMTGDDALPRIKEIRADVPVIVMSGYSEIEASRRFGPGLLFLQKPFSVAELAKKLRQMRLL
ncbi:MAG: response regulator [Armatimonadota bacterium]|nr:response regulator [Armatimonadota bacterium]